VTVATRVALASAEARSPLLRALRRRGVPVRGRRVCSEASSCAAEGEEAASREEGEGENASAMPAVLGGAAHGGKGKGIGEGRGWGGDAGFQV